MSNVFKWIQSVVVALINICLLCGAGYFIDWVNYVFNKRVTNAGSEVKRVALKTFIKILPVPVNDLHDKTTNHI